MDWNVYEKLLIRQIQDAEFNLEYTTKKYEAAKKEYRELLDKQKAFNKALEKLLGDGS